MIFEKQIVNTYKGMMHARCDDNGTAFYFSAKDFSGLKCEEYAFLSSAGNKLQGYIYSYENSHNKDGRIVVFDHGFGGGHRAYMKEIERLCAHGYLVFAYDHTGCMESEGESAGGMAQSLCDLNDCICALKSDNYFKDLDISVMGHSWGGFSTLNISALHKDISHVVVLSGFVSVQTIVGTFFSGIMKGYRKPILALEGKSNPKFVGFNAIESLKDSNANILLIYSDNDQLVRKSHFDALKVGLSHKPNVKLVLEHNKGHNPNYTEDAVNYLGQYLEKKKKLVAKKKLSTDEEKRIFLESFDWDRMTKQDDRVWGMVFECLDKV